MLLSSPWRNKHQQGFTLLEMLIALSIFSLIGIASYRVLSTTIDSQRAGQIYSEQLAHGQKILAVIDRDLQQIIPRNIRSSDAKTEHFLVVNGDEYPLTITRGGVRNPLQLARSSMQRIAYDIGFHPRAEDRSSPFYGDTTQYLRRHIWYNLDRNTESLPMVQALVPDVADLVVSVITDSGRQVRWPPKKSNNSSQDELLAVEFSWRHSDQDLQINRIYQFL